MTQQDRTQQGLNNISQIINSAGQIVGMNQTKKAREQQAGQFQQGLDFQKDNARFNRGMTVAQAVNAQKQQQRQDYRSRINDWRESKNEAQEQAKMNAFVNGIRGFYANFGQGGGQ